MNYTYFAATLPALEFGAEPSMTEHNFRERCREHLGNADFATLCALLDDGKTTHAYVKNWRDCDTQLRNAIALQRAMRLGDAGAAERWQRPHVGFDLSIANAVNAAFQEADPKSRDFALERIRWNFAGDLAGFDPFSAEAIFAYAIRLSILIRNKTDHAEKGTDRLYEMMKIQAASEE